MTDLNKIKKAVNDTVDNVIDKTSESVHRTAADGERAHRDLDGDQMTTTEKIASVKNETKERAAAGIDHAKQAVRDRT